jgi:hypothetical protein
MLDCFILSNGLKPNPIDVGIMLFGIYKIKILNCYLFFDLPPAKAGDKIIDLKMALAELFCQLPPFLNGGIMLIFENGFSQNTIPCGIYILT